MSALVVAPVAFIAGAATALIWSFHRKPKAEKAKTKRDLEHVADVLDKVSHATRNIAHLTELVGVAQRETDEAVAAAHAAQLGRAS